MCAVATTPVIGTERLNLRHPTRRDIPAYVEFCGDFNVSKMTTRMPHPYEAAHAEEWLATLGDHGREEVNFAIDDGSGMVGGLGFFINEDGQPEIGYWIAPPRWGKGYATEAVRAALKWARSVWGKKVIYAGHFADNPASGAVLIKAGFLYTGEVKRKHSVARGEEVALRMMVWIA